MKAHICETAKPHHIVSETWTGLLTGRALDKLKRVLLPLTANHSLSLWYSNMRDKILILQIQYLQWKSQLTDYIKCQKAFCCPLLQIWREWKKLIKTVKFVWTVHKFSVSEPKKSRIPNFTAYSLNQDKLKMLPK